MSSATTFLSDDKWRYRAFYQIGRGLVSVPLGWYTRLSIHGGENIPASGAFILAPVHRSFMDTPFTTLVTRRRLRFMGKDSMWKIGWLGKVFSALGAFPITRGSADRESMKRALRILSDYNEGLVLFPEGERKQGSVVFPPLEGAVYLAVKAGVPIVPMGIGGSEWVMPKSAKFIYPRRVHLEVGEAIMPPTATDGKRIPRAAYGETADLLRDRLQELFDIAMSKVPQEYPTSGSDPAGIGTDELADEGATS